MVYAESSGENRPVNEMFTEAINVLDIWLRGEKLGIDYAQRRLRASGVFLNHLLQRSVVLFTSSIHGGLCNPSAFRQESVIMNDIVVPCVAIARNPQALIVMSLSVRCLLSEQERLLKTVANGEQVEITALTQAKKFFVAVRGALQEYSL